MGLLGGWGGVMGEKMKGERERIRTNKVWLSTSVIAICLSSETDVKKNILY